MSGGNNGQNLFHRILPATTKGLKSKTAVNWHLKVKDIEYNVVLTKNYCITVSMQKFINSFSRFYGLMNLMATSNFDHIQPKITGITFSFLEFVPACRKSVHFIYSFLRYSHFQSSLTRLPTLISDQAHPQIFWSTFHLCKFVSKCKKSGYFIDLF